MLDSGVSLCLFLCPHQNENEILMISIRVLLHPTHLPLLLLVIAYFIRITIYHGAPEEGVQNISRIMNVSLGLCKGFYPKSGIWHHRMYLLNTTKVFDVTLWQRSHQLPIASRHALSSVVCIPQKNWLQVGLRKTAFPVLVR